MIKTLWNIVVIGGLILTLTYWEGARKFVKKAMITLRDLAFSWIYLFQLLTRKAPKGQPSPTSGEATGTSSKKSSTSSSKFKRGRSIDEN